MVSMDQAEKYVRSKLADNLDISMSWESKDDYVFELALKGEDGQLLSLFGSNTVRINKETGEME